MVRDMTLLSLASILACTQSTIVDDTTDKGGDTNGGGGDTSTDDTGGAGLEIGAYSGPTLYINEVMSDIVKDETRPSASGDWLEIYNPGEEDISLTGFFLDRNTIGTGAAWPFPSGESVAAHDWYVVGLKSFEGSDKIDIVADFHSSKEADLLWLYMENADGTAGVADSVEWTEAILAPESLARSPDGGEFAHTGHPTPGGANQ